MDLLRKDETPLVPRQWKKFRPESLPHPKRALVDLARRSSVRAIREDLVPEPGSAAIVGRGYTPRMTEFIEDRAQCADTVVDDARCVLLLISAEPSFAIALSHFAHVRGE